LELDKVRPPIATDDTHADGDFTAQEHRFVVPDPCTVLNDALHYTSWTADGGSLPQRGDWSTYRLASKDLILGVMTHRFNATTRCLDVRSYFAGEHPLFEELEATRGLVAMLLCQAYQVGHSLKLLFEYGVPFDVRVLIERLTGHVVSGDTTLLTDEVTGPLFIKLSGISDRLQTLVADQGVSLGMVCYHVFRGTWSPNQINTLLERGVPLTWLFKRSPDRIGAPAPFAHLLQHLRAVLLEEYALKRLGDRQFGETTSMMISMIDGEKPTMYVSEMPLQLTGADGMVQIAAGEPFSMLPLFPATLPALVTSVRHHLQRLSGHSPACRVVVALPMDVVHGATSTEKLAQTLRAADANWVIVGQTMSQLMSEVDQKLSVTAAQIDENELDARNLDRYTD